MAAGDGGKALGVAMSNPTLDGVLVTSVLSAENSSLKLGFYGVTAITQPASALQATLTATWVACSTATGFGFLTSDQAISVIAAIQQIQTVLKTIGLWKGSA